MMKHSAGLFLLTSYILLHHCVQSQPQGKPGFNSTNYTTSIDESVATGTQLDLYIQANGVDGTSATFSITDKNITAFSINSTSGVISTAQSLDYETQQLYQFRIGATDVSTTYTANVTIVVSDVNDNSPVFNQLVYTSTLPSGALTEWSTRVVATDQDSGSNAAITYNITDGNAAKIFTINSTTGEIRATGIAKYSAFILTVNATDGGTPTRNGQAAVVIIAPCDSKASRHSAKLLLYPLLSSLVLIVSATLGI